MTCRDGRDVDLPAWPALMDILMATAYTSLGDDAFKALMARHGVRPVDLGTSSVRWRRADIDAVIDKLPARATKSRADAPDNDHHPPQVPDLMDPALAGLEKARRRARG